MAAPKIFVSHSTKDTAFASKLVNDLKNAGADAWMDVNNLGAGNFQERIDAALAECKWFLLVLTRDALASEWVRQEVYAANRLKNQGKIKELIFIKAADVDHRELPATWGVFNVFDAVLDYEAALDKTLKAIVLPPTATDAAKKRASGRDVGSKDGRELSSGITTYAAIMKDQIAWRLAHAVNLYVDNKYSDGLAIDEEVIQAINRAVEECQNAGCPMSFIHETFGDYYVNAWISKSKALAALGFIDASEEAWRVVELGWPY